MKQYFTEEQRKNGLNVFEIEDVLFTGEFLEGSGKDYRVGGSAVIDGEKYNDFVIEFELAAMPAAGDPEEIMGMDWESYDFVFESGAE